MQSRSAHERIVPDPTGSAEQRYRLLVEQIPAITYIADWGGLRPFLYVSPQAEELLGYPPEEWVADVAFWDRILHPEDRERVLAEEQRTMAAEERFEQEYRLVAKDGRVVWIWERDTIIRDAEGNPVCTQGVLVDVTELKHTQLALADSEGMLREERDRAQRYLDIAATMITVLGADGRVQLVNKRACEVLGYKEPELLGQNWFDVIVPASDREPTRGVFKQLMAGDIESTEEYENHVVSKTGEERLISWHNTVLRDESGRTVGMLSSGEDITERRKAQERVVYLAYHDQLTGLPNRAMLGDHLTVAVARARRTKVSAALLCLDVDDFKLVNDSLGHSVGDELLLAVTSRLNAVKRDGDVLARAGGDEFFLLLPDLPEDGEGPALAAAQRVVAAFQEPFDISGAELHVSASVGVSVSPSDAADADELLRHADAAMYQAKRDARSNYALYEPEQDDPLVRLSLTARLRKSVKRAELVLHYQPIFTLPEGKPVAVEALLRWHDPERGLVGPAEFIPAAENTGLIELARARPDPEAERQRLTARAAATRVPGHAGPRAQSPLGRAVAADGGGDRVRRDGRGGRGADADLEAQRARRGDRDRRLRRGLLLPQPPARAAGAAAEDRPLVHARRARERGPLRGDHGDHPPGRGAGPPGRGRGSGDRGAAPVPDRAGLSLGAGLPPEPAPPGRPGDRVAAAQLGLLSRRMRTLLIAAIALCALALPATASAAKRCRPIDNPYAGTRYDGVDITRIRATRVTCLGARRVAKRAHHKGLGITPPPSGIRSHRQPPGRSDSDMFAESPL